MSKKDPPRQPLYDLLRPRKWEDFYGLHDIEDPVIRGLESGAARPPSLIFWGPPGSGKTTLASLIGSSFSLKFVAFSAVLGGVKEVREIVKEAKEGTEPTILFVDEIHRFSKSQQDAFLPHIEDGTIILIGATTENPSFYCTGALLSRAKVVQLKPLSSSALFNIAKKALAYLELSLTEEALNEAVRFSAGDARRLLNLLESLAALTVEESEPLGFEQLQEHLKDPVFFYDKTGEEHYNMVSAFIKSMRGSDADAALFWAFRMIASGEDPRFIIRRMIIFASEDIGNADPRALQLSVATAEAFDRLGLPEGKIPIAHCVTYLASAPKSNRSYVALKRAEAAIKRFPRVTVPINLRNAPTKLMKDLDYGKDYRYPHDFEGGYVKDVNYLPPELKREEKFYEPGNLGYEQKLADWMKRLKG